MRDQAEARLPLPPFPYTSDSTARSMEYSLRSLLFHTYTLLAVALRYCALASVPSPTRHAIPSDVLPILRAEVFSVNFAYSISGVAIIQLVQPDTSERPRFRSETLVPPMTALGCLAS